MKAGVALATAMLVCVAGSTTAQRPTLKSGLDLTSLDTSVRPQDDLYRYMNGGWLARTEVPPDRVTYSASTALEERVYRDLQAIIEEVAALPNPQPGSPEQQIADLYLSLTDEAWIEALGVKPIRERLDHIFAIDNPSDVAIEAGELASIGTGGPFGASIALDPANPRMPAVHLSQSGIMLPDRDYYLVDHDTYVGVHREYERYLTRIFTLIGRPRPAEDATALLALETKLAEAQWTRAESRNPLKTNNPFTLKKLETEMPGFDWRAWAKPQGIDKIRTIVVAQPSFFQRFAELMQSEPLESWKIWLAARYVTASAPFLSSDFANARFEFFGLLLTGQEEPIERWKRGVSLVNGYLGDALGRLYVDRHFPATSKARVQKIVDNVLSAYRRAILQLDWMSDSTKEEALLKLSAIDAKIGFPDRWRDFRGLEIRRDDLIGNIQRAKQFETTYRTRWVGRRTNRSGWLMTPQTINAYYSPVMHEIVFPAAILQPPFFDAEADDAVNYGSIGAIIGHEIGHALDDRGRYFDADGQLREWWTPEDATEYRERTMKLIEQFNAYSPSDGLRVNGVLTLGENFGDLGGLVIAYRAWKLSLGNRPADVIDGYSGDQRFFLGWAQMWRTKVRDEYLRQFVLSNPHAPARFRTNGPVSNMPEFYSAFDVQPGDGLFRGPAERVRIW
jgi:predicted metalloendopeptidase